MGLAVSEGGKGGVEKARYQTVLTKLQALEGAQNGPFGRAEWFALCAAHGRNEPQIIVSGNTALPLQRTENGLEALANWYSFVWCPVGDESGCPDAALALRKHETRVTLAPVADENGTATALAKAFRDAGWVVRREQCDVNHVLHVNRRSYAEYLASLPGRLRTTLKRKAKKVTCQIHTAFNAAAWDNYEAIYADSWKPEEGLPAMLRAFAEAEGAAGRLRLAVALDGDTPVAAQFWTVEDGTAYIHKLAHLESAKPLSPGTTLTAALMEHVIDRDGVALVDFGTGDDPYKRAWMDAVRPRFRITAYNPRTPRNWPALVRLAISRLASRQTDG